MTVSLKNIGKTYQSPDGEIEAILNISLDLEDGEFISIVGPSGCGKSTLLSIVAGLEKPSEGEVLVENEPVTGTTGRIGYMLQKDQLFPWRTIWGNVMLGPEIRRSRDEETKKHVRDLIERYGLSEFADKIPAQLSGGMRQRCALIRTLATDPHILLLDEPFSALDYQTRLAVSNDIHSIIRQEGKTALLVTHDISESVSMSDRVVVLSTRPATVKAVYDLAELRGLSPMERRNHTEFKTYFNAIWKEMDISV